MPCGAVNSLLLNKRAVSALLIVTNDCVPVFVADETSLVPLKGASEHVINDTIGELQAGTQ